MSNNTQPEIRFPGFTEDWEERKLSEMANFSKGNGYSKADLAEEGHPVILYGRLYTKYETIIENVDTFAELKEKSVISNGGEVIVPASGETPEDISRASVVDVSGVALGGDLNIIKTKSELDPIFLALTISNGSQQKEMTKRAQGKSVVHLHNSDLKEVNLLYPKLDEQVKIGSFFKKLDVSIALHQRKLDLLKETKKGFLQKMFPKNGAKVPEIRFPGFTEDWEERKLNEGMTEYTDRVYIQDDEIYKQVSVKNVGEITLRGEQIGSKIGRKRQAKVNLIEHPDTLIFTRQTIEQGGIGFAPKETDGAIVTENMPTIDVDNDIINCNYLLAYVKTEDWYRKVILKNIEGGTAQIAIHEDSILSSEVLIPKIEEQQKIGTFFKQIDDTIALHQSKLDLLKETKKGFLQKMFV